MIGSNRLRIGGEAMAIVQTLREFGDQPVPTGVIAQAVGRDEEEIADSLNTLSEKGVVEVVDDRRGRRVKLLKR